MSKNILFVVPYTPNLIRTRPYNLIHGLLRQGHKITLVTLWENEQELEELNKLGQKGIRVICTRLTKSRSAWNTLRVLLTPIPLQAVYCWQPKLMEILESQTAREQFDVIHVEHLRGAHYGLWFKSHFLYSNPRPPIIWDSVDCISYLFEQATHTSRSLFGIVVTRLELNRTRRYEGWLAGQFDRVLITSLTDKNALMCLVRDYSQCNNITNANPESITVLSNGVDLDYFKPTDQPRESATIIFSGKMSYHANVTAASYLVNDIMPFIWAKRPEVQVLIVGKNPPAKICQLATRNPQHITVTGLVPDIRPYLARATIATCPLRYGAGIQNKVLEAMAMGIPVVATPQAISALETRDGEHLLVSDKPEAFAQTVLRLLESRELQQKIGEAGRQYVEKYHGWDAITERLVAIYDLAI